MSKTGRPPALTDDQVRQIREAVEAGASQASVALGYGISRSLVSLICRGVRYPDAPGPITYSYSPRQTGQTA
ncbi:helix-turn-helix DNA binding domain protein [Arthrobacter phage Prairie]|uniref:Helix-turn-helix DNA binding domain protein n=1 Tax=Arthrobacter phage Prairie TaxID=2816463 RepID=A0A8A5LQ85_9CAUD|nr:helix-turn-helix DNA binding domain protein [Arthrobacter phage Prairie]